MRVAELTRRLGVPYRDVRYVLEQGYLPIGVEESPGRGEHRDLTHAQAYWLAMVLLLKQSGIRTPLAAEIANFTQDVMPNYASQFESDAYFQPFKGSMVTKDEWFVEIGELKYIRIMIVSDYKSFKTVEHPWFFIAKIKDTVIGDPGFAHVDPLVTIRVDMSKLAGRLSSMTE